ncbi:hypothetical protein [Ammonifex thiophilus]|uniref:Uncharacterized protein n=1 Tax=Ammonifex thiophilus TaxID=444093 RepID=A0A3D8P1R8_9THEO|nr:hypothetical protein [Ammonifex thiophilus]RDV81802.1 hypothetical protein DXX99_08865 [Ammonifex thiophilus]
MRTGEKVKAVQVRLSEEEWRFLRRLAVDLDTTVSEIIRGYIGYLRRGGRPVGLEEKEQERNEKGAGLER